MTTPQILGALSFLFSRLNSDLNSFAKETGLEEETQCECNTHNVNLLVREVIALLSSVNGDAMKVGQVIAERSLRENSKLYELLDEKLTRLFDEIDVKSIVSGSAAFNPGNTQHLHEKN